MNRYISVGLLVALAPAAQAADLPVMEAAAAPAYAEAAPDFSYLYSGSGFSWSGFYAGVNAAHTFGPARSAGVTSGVVTDVDISGGLLGATAGYNAQYGQFVLGLEGDIGWSDASGASSCALATTRSCTGEVNWIGSVRGRAGVAYDSVLLFATAGLTAAEVTASINPALTGITSSYTDTMTGWTVGAGIETLLTEAISIKAEYSYSDLGELQAPGGTLASEATNLSAINHAIKFGLNYHF